MGAWTGRSWSDEIVRAERQGLEEASQQLVLQKGREGKELGPSVIQLVGAGDPGLVLVPELSTKAIKSIAGKERIFILSSAFLLQTSILLWKSVEVSSALTSGSLPESIQLYFCRVCCRDALGGKLNLSSALF